MITYDHEEHAKNIAKLNAAHDAADAERALKSALAQTGPDQVALVPDELAEAAKRLTDAGYDVGPLAPDTPELLGCRDEAKTPRTPDLWDMARVNPAKVAKLRKMKKLPLKVKAVVYGGNIGGAGMTMQFNRDIQVYGLWEALLYVEGYEKDGMYRKGTAVKAWEAIK